MKTTFREPSRIIHPAHRLLVLLLACFSTELSAANFTVEARPTITFSPSNLDISVGDSVTWVNAGGLHNVEASDGSFRCSNGCDGMGGDRDPSTDAWSFTLTFNQVGTINYECGVHGPQGMIGSINVKGGPAEPGSLRFTAASMQISEGGGSVQLAVSRVGGSDGAVSAAFATTQGSAQAGEDFTSSSGMVSWTNGESSNKTIQILITDDAIVEGNESLTVSLTAPTGGASLGSPATATVTILDDDATSPGTLRFNTVSTQVGEDAGNALLRVQRIGGDDGVVGLSYSTSDGSASSGADYSSEAGGLWWSDGDTSDQMIEIPIQDDAEPEPDETFTVALSAPSGGASLGA